MSKLTHFIPTISKLGYGLNRQSPLNAARRHWITFLRYNSAKKMINLIMILIQFALKRTVVKGYPFILKVEPTSRCNLRCPGCIAHGSDFPIEEADMPLELFKKICDEMSDYVYKISLYITGEPLLNAQIFDMIAYATSKRIGTVISSNFHAFNEEKAEKMIEAGLSHLIVCLDGVSQETYGKYRVGGKVERVLKNLDILARKKKEKGGKLPFLEIQAIRHDENEEELPKIREVAKRVGADRFTVREDFRNYEPAKKDRTCFWLWFTALITEKGVIIPCCASAWWDTEKKDFGNMNASSFREAWNNEKYVEARTLFRTKEGRTKIGNREKPLCSGCDIFLCPERQPGDDSSL